MYWFYGLVENLANIIGQNVRVFLTHSDWNISTLHIVFFVNSTFITNIELFNIVNMFLNPKASAV